MESNKDEAARAMEIAERKMAAKEYDAARRLIARAHRLYPSMDGFAQANVILDVLSAAEPKTPGGVSDWYAVLQLTAFESNENTIRKQYKKLALQLHPDKNCLPAAVDAFKLVTQAHNALGTPSSKVSYDERLRRTNFVPHAAPPNPPPRTGVNGCGFGRVDSRAQGKYVFTRSFAPKTDSSRNAAANNAFPSDSHRNAPKSSQDAAKMSQNEHKSSQNVDFVTKSSPNVSSAAKMSQNAPKMSQNDDSATKWSQNADFTTKRSQNEYIQRYGVKMSAESRNGSKMSSKDEFLRDFEVNVPRKRSLRQNGGNTENKAQKNSSRSDDFHRNAGIKLPAVTDRSRFSNLRSCETSIRNGEFENVHRDCKNANGNFRDVENVDDEQCEEMESMWEDEEAGAFLGKEGTFWTACEYCHVQFQYCARYENKLLVCSCCSKNFIALQSVTVRSAYVPFIKDMKEAMVSEDFSSDECTITQEPQPPILQSKELGGAKRFCSLDAKQNGEEDRGKPVGYSVVDFVDKKKIEIIVLDDDSSDSDVEHIGELNTDFLDEEPRFSVSRGNNRDSSPEDFDKFVKVKEEDELHESYCSMKGSAAAEGSEKPKSSDDIAQEEDMVVKKVRMDLSGKMRGSITAIADKIIVGLPSKNLAWKSYSTANEAGSSATKSPSSRLSSYSERFKTIAAGALH